MARVTVEDCVLKIPNRFDLVMLAAQRARDISSGAALTLERDNDKNPVVALREIADESVDIENLAEALVQGMQKYVEVDEPEEDIVEFDAPQVGGPEAEMVLAGLGAASEEAEEEAPEAAASEEGEAKAEAEAPAQDEEPAS